MYIVNHLNAVKYFTVLINYIIVFQVPSHQIKAATNHKRATGMCYLYVFTLTIGKIHYLLFYLTRLLFSRCPANKSRQPPITKGLQVCANRIHSFMSTLRCTCWFTARQRTTTMYQIDVSNLKVQIYKYNKVTTRPIHCRKTFKTATKWRTD